MRIRQHFYHESLNPQLRCEISSDSGNAGSIIINPNLPECVGICINHHTNTQENIGQSSNITLGELKSGHIANDVKITRCDQCIKNFYKSLKLMKDKNNF